MINNAGSVKTPVPDIMEDWNNKLTTAAEKGDIEALKLSLQNGAEIDYQNVGGWTALMLAAREGYLEICRLLIDTGCKIDITGGGGETALMLAAMTGHLEICKLLIDTGCKIDITEKMDGYTALHLAAQYGHLQTTRCLVEQGGASPLVKSHKEQLNATKWAKHVADIIKR
ncbi:RIPK4 [Mytilus coruscus]|uniref:RIPK4 n=1 Tax=Mytilus coruscus TaxID=42192 RepID=A0A6J8CW85_MYTCO|nr:RIPK4 [Mytilus coruscus]